MIVIAGPNTRENMEGERMSCCFFVFIKVFVTGMKPKDYDNFLSCGVCVCVSLHMCMCLHAMVYMWRLEDNLKSQFFSSIMWGQEI